MYKLTWRCPASNVVHIVAMPRSALAFSACCAYQFTFKVPDNVFAPGIATCLACWAREIFEWELETTQKGS